MLEPATTQIVDTLWKIIEPASTDLKTPVHVKELFTPEQVEDLPLPLFTNESISQLAGPSGWYDQVASGLAELASHHVVCSINRSQANDHQLFPEAVKSLNAVLQLRGTTIWSYWPGSAMRPQRIDTEPGDLLLLPRDTSRSADAIGTSIYAVFAFHEPI